MRPIVSPRKAALLGGLIACLAMPAAADSDTYPAVEGKAKLRLEYQRAEDGAAWRHDGFTDSEAELELKLSPNLSINAHLHVEPLRARTGDRAFDDHGLYLEELYVAGERGPLGLFGGKFNPAFGVAWYVVPGVFATDFAEDYQRKEAIGVGGSVKLADAEFGTHRFTGAGFFLDGTALSNAVGARPRFGLPDTKRPGRLGVSDGGAGNTGSLDSFTATLDGGEAAHLPGLRYHLGHGRLARGRDQSRAEQSYAAALYAKLEPLKTVDAAPEWTRNLTFAPLVEQVWINHAGGNTGGKEQNRRYLSTALEIGLGDWTLTASRTSRVMHEPADGTGPNGGDFQDRLATVNLGYSFGSGITVEGGWKRERRLAVDSDWIGVRVLYDVRF